MKKFLFFALALGFINISVAQTGSKTTNNNAPEIQDPSIEQIVSLISDSRKLITVWAWDSNYYYFGDTLSTDWYPSFHSFSAEKNRIGKTILSYGLQYDTATAKWSNYNKSVYEYYGDTLYKGFYDYRWDSASAQYLTEPYYYVIYNEASNLLKEYYCDTTNEDWAYIYYEENTYNAMQQKTSYYNTTYYRSGTYLSADTNRESYVYNDKNLLTHKEASNVDFYQYGTDTNVSYEYNYEDYTYNALDLKESLVSTWISMFSNDTSYYYTMYKYAYNSSNQLIADTNYSKYYDTASWDLSALRTYTYNADGLNDTMTQYFWTQDYGWQPGNMKVTTYDNGLVTSVTDYYFSNTWQAYMRQRYEYNDAGYLTKSVFENYDYNANKWVTQSMDIYEYDDENHLTHTAYYTYVYSLDTIALSREYYYDSEITGDIYINTRTSYYYIEGKLYSRRLSKNYYGKFQFNNVNRVLPVAISVYPNPAQDVIHFDVQGINKVEIISTNGRVIKTYNTSQNYINVSDLTSGVYILRIYDNNNDIRTSSFIKR